MEPGKIRKVYGTGGIGTGIFFQLKGDHTLGRDESRLGHLTDFADYCKGHIILHYIAQLTQGVEVYPLGKVGRDEQGAMLLRQMREAGLNTRFVQETGEARTMFAVCFQYPDGAGGNITTSNSACELVTPAYVEQCAEGVDASSMVLAAPEVPMESRIRLLQIAKSRSAFTASDFLSAEAPAFENAGGFLHSDLIAMNLDEARALCGNKPGLPVEAVFERIDRANPEAKVIVTCGKEGCYYREGAARDVLHLPSYPVEVISTAGAGDALLGGVMAGIIQGKTFPEAVEYGAVVARFAVLSEHTIARDVRMETIDQFIRGRSNAVSAAVCPEN